MPVLVALAMAGLALLTVAADQLVVGAGRLAAWLGVSPVVVGVVVIRLGTSAPEYVVSVVATSRGDAGLAVANLVGSNIINVTLILGLAALVASVTVRSSIPRREAPLSVAAVIAFPMRGRRPARGAGDLRGRHPSARGLPHRRPPARCRPRRHHPRLRRRFDHVRLGDGDEVDLGGLTLQALATPGHTDEHLSFLLRDGATPVGVFTGGSLIVGSAARTDLLGADRTEELARARLGPVPALFATAGLTLGQIGTLAALYLAVWGLGQLATGPLSDRFGRKPLIVSGMLLQAAALAWTAAATTFAVWARAAAVLGVGTAMVYPTLLADVAHPAWRARAVGVYRLWRDGGFAIGALLAGILADANGIRTATCAVPALTAASGLFAAVRMYETHHSGQRATSASIKRGRNRWSSHRRELPLRPLSAVRRTRGLLGENDAVLNQKIVTFSLVVTRGGCSAFPAYGIHLSVM